MTPHEEYFIALTRLSILRAQGKRDGPEVTAERMRLTVATAGMSDRDKLFMATMSELWNHAVEHIVAILAPVKPSPANPGD